MTILDDLFGSFVDDVHLEAERSGEPVNERHLASIRRARALTLQQVEETVQVLTSPPAADPPQTTPPAARTSPASERSGAPSAA